MIEAGTSVDGYRVVRLIGRGGMGVVYEAVQTSVNRNVLVGDGDQAYLADFGLTRVSAETTIAASRPMLGSVAYVAPEVVRGEEPTPASDRYSVAATLFHCLTGDVVFPRGSEAAVLYAHATEPPRRRTSAATSCPVRSIRCSRRSARASGVWVRVPPPELSCQLRARSRPARGVSSTHFGG